MKRAVPSSIKGLQRLGRLLRESRRAQELSQDEVAKAVGVKQSAVSAFENGHTDTVSKEKLIAWEAFLELSTSTGESSANSSSSKKTAICVNPICPSHTDAMGDGPFKRPVPESIIEGQKYCRECGDTLHTECPKCFKPVDKGAFCMFCGRQYVQVVNMGSMK